MRLLSSTFHMKLLDTLGGPRCQALAITEDGIIVGAATTAQEAEHACIWTPDGIVDLDPTGNYRSAVTAITSKGFVGGVIHRENGTSSAIVWRNGQVLWRERWDSSLGSINDAGIAVGSVTRIQNPTPGAAMAVLWQNGELCPLETPLVRYHYACDINNSGQIVGGGLDTAFLIDDGQCIPIMFDDIAEGTASAINENGEIAGFCENPKGKMEAFFWADGDIVGIGHLGAFPSHARGINNEGYVVGDSAIKLPRRSISIITGHAFLWRDGVIVDLNDLVADLDGWTLDMATDISDGGRIIASAVRESVWRAVVLDPE